MGQMAKLSFYNYLKVNLNDKSFWTEYKKGLSVFILVLIHIEFYCQLNGKVIHLVSAIIRNGSMNPGCW